MRRILSLIGVCFVFLLAVQIGLLHGTHCVPPSRARILVVSPSGERLISLFEGRPHDPLLALERVQARPTPCSKAESHTKLPVLAGTTVHACGTCQPIDGCLGKNWLEESTSCNTGGGCSGSYELAEPDPLRGSPNVGWTRDGTACGGCSECGCAEPTCDNNGGIH
jgi:hypothetical protein